MDGWMIDRWMRRCMDGWVGRWVCGSLQLEPLVLTRAHSHEWASYPPKPAWGAGEQRCPRVTRDKAATVLGSQWAAGRQGRGNKDSWEVRGRKSTTHPSAGTAWPARRVGHTTRALPVPVPGDQVRGQHPEPGARAGRGLGPAVGPLSAEHCDASLGAEPSAQEGVCRGAVCPVTAQASQFAAPDPEGSPGAQGPGPATWRCPCSPGVRTLTPWFARPPTR